MLRNVVALLARHATTAASGSASTSTAAAASGFWLAARGFKAVADVEIDFNNREVFKKYIGIRDHLSKEPGTRGKLMEALSELVTALKVLPEKSDYRKAVESTCAYRIKVCEQNETDGDIEEVLDAHLEELIYECREELRLIPVMSSEYQGLICSVHAHVPCLVFYAL